MQNVVLEGEQIMVKHNLQNYKKQDINFDNDLKLCIGRTYGINQDSRVLHWHNSVEICYVKHGSGIYLIGGRKYTFSQGDIFVIGSKDMHLAYNDTDVILQVMLFEPDLIISNGNSLYEMDYIMPFWEAGISFENKLERTNKYYELTVDLLIKIEEEYNKRKLGYKMMVKALLLQFAAILTRYLNLKSNGLHSEKMKNYARLKPVFDYMDGNFNAEVRLSELAGIINMSVSNFSLIFKKIMGVSPIDYLIRMRIAKASRILLETDMKITNIAESCGFSSTSHFVQHFKKYTGLSPSAFRKNKNSK